MRRNGWSAWLASAILLGIAVLVARMLLGCTPALRVAVAPTPTPPGNISRLFDWGGHASEPWDAVQFAAWAWLNPAKGAYSWSAMDARLDAVAPKKVHLLVTVYRSDQGKLVYDGPAWAGAPKVLSGCGTTVEIPPYDNATWRGHYATFVAALGARYDGDPRIGSVVVSTGLDSETQATKATTCDWMGLIRSTALERGFSLHVDASMAAYAKAFPRTTLYLSSAPGLGRMERAKLAAKYGIGLKHAGMWYDLNSWEGYGGAEGSWDAMKAYSRTLPIWVESPHWGSVENLRWSLFAGLSYYPTGMSLHPDYLVKEMRSILDWTAAHIGVTAASSPSAWAVLRDAEYPASDWGGKGVRGHVGNWGKLLTVTGGERRWRDQLPAAQSDWRSRQCRWGMTFTIQREAAFVRDGYRVRVTYLDVGTGAMTLGNVKVWRANTNAWRVWEVTPVGGGPWTLDMEQGGYVHMVEILGDGSVTATPWPSESRTTTGEPPLTWTPAPTGTPTATCSPTVTWTPTATLCPTVTRTVSTTAAPTYTGTATPTATGLPTPTATGEPTETRTIEDDARALRKRIAEEWGVDARVFVEVGP